MPGKNIKQGTIAPIEDFREKGSVLLNKEYRRTNKINIELGIEKINSNRREEGETLTPKNSEWTRVSGVIIIACVMKNSANMDSGLCTL